jgi:hypothetical protein
MNINISEIDPSLILNISTTEYIGFLLIPFNYIFYLYQTTSISIIRFVLNLFNVIVFFKKEFNSPMFFYFKVQSVCNLIINLTGIPYSLCNAGRYQSEENRKLCAYYLVSFVAFGTLLAHYQPVLDPLICD